MTEQRMETSEFRVGDIVRCGADPKVYIVTSIYGPAREYVDLRASDDTSWMSDLSNLTWIGHSRAEAAASQRARLAHAVVAMADRYATSRENWAHFDHLDRPAQRDVCGRAYRRQLAALRRLTAAMR